MPSTFEKLWLESARITNTGRAEWWSKPFDPDDVAHEFTAVLMEKYQYYYSEHSPGEIYFPFRSYFFSITENCPVYGRQDGKVVDLQVPQLKAIYVRPEYRRRGIQGAVLEELTKLTDEVSEPLMAFVGPFQIPSGTDIIDSMDYFVLYRDQSIADDSALRIKQRNRLKSEGFVNHVWPHFRTTTPADHFLFVPSEYDVEFS